MTLFKNLKPLKIKREFTENDRLKLEAISHLRKSVDRYLLGFENVTGVFTGYKWKKGKPTDEFAILVGVTRKVPLEKLGPHQIIPPSFKTIYKGKTIEIVTDIIPFGRFRLGGRRDNSRPAYGGDSIGRADLPSEPRIGGCTLGVKVKDNITGKPGFVTASHPFHIPYPLSSNWVYKPSRADGGGAGGINDRIGVYERGIPEQWTGSFETTVDAALVILDNVGDLSIGLQDLDWSHNFAYYDPSWDPAPDLSRVMWCAKSGRTTEVTFGIFLGIEGTIPLPTPSGTVTFRDQFLVMGWDPNALTPTNYVFFDEGDSGALLIGQVQNPQGQLTDAGIGLLIGWLATIDPYFGLVTFGVATPWYDVEKNLNISKWTEGGDDDNGWSQIVGAYLSDAEDLVNWLEKERHAFAKTPFGKKIMDWYRNLKKADAAMLLLEDAEAVEASIKVAATARRLYKSNKEKLKNEDIKNIQIVLNKLAKITNKDDMPTLKKLARILEKSRNKTLKNIIENVKGT